MIKEYLLNLEVGKTNGVYNKIYNCRAVMPSYEIDEGQLGTKKGLYNSEFFLDKRFGMEEFHNRDGFHFTDDIELYGEKYYLYHNYSEWYVGVKDGDTIKDISGPFDYSINNPLRFAHGRSGKGEAKEINLSINNAIPLADDDSIRSDLAIYDGGYIVLDVGTGLNIEAGDFVVFESNIFEGGAVEVELYQDGKIYVLGINDRGSIPTGSDTISIYESTGKVPVIGTAEGVKVIHINGKEVCGATTPLNGDIDDVVSYDEALFALKDEKVFYSRKTFDDSVQFYDAPRGDVRRLDGGYKLVSKGKFLMCLGYDNRLVSATPDSSNSTTTISIYHFYPLNYNGDLYSKYSYLFTESDLYFLQKDKELMKVDITNLNNSAFNLKVTNITKGVRGLLEDIADEGFIICNTSNSHRYLHFLYQDGKGNTIDYEYDKEYEHWLIQTYEGNTLYKITDQHLCKDYVTNIGGYEDLGEKYEQSINFIIFEKGHALMPGFVRTIFGLHDEGHLDVHIDVSIEANHAINEKNLRVRDLTLDLLPSDHMLDIESLFDNNNINKHNGNIASVQKRIMRTGRYIKFDYHSYDRFIYGYSYIPCKITSIFVNEMRNIS